MQSEYIQEHQHLHITTSEYTATSYHCKFGTINIRISSALIINAHILEATPLPSTSHQ